jgi:D-glycero-D-manno-heptose 1,7-bisphosphate phosphatase
MTTARPAVFLDRDGTINADAHYVRRAEDVVLLPGAAAAIARLNTAGLPVIVVSNQSGIGRGMFTMKDYERVRARLGALLAAEGARVDATYICPHAPDAPGCECRKPGTTLFRQAARDHGIALDRSWYIGDRWRDVAPAAVLGGHGILVPGPDTSPDDVEQARSTMAVAATLGAAVDEILAAAPLQNHPR